MTKLYNTTKINGSAMNRLANLTQKSVSNQFKWITKLMLFIHVLFILSALLNNATAQTYAPKNYWTFNSSPFNKDSMNNFNLDFTSYNCGYSLPATPTGKGLELNTTTSHNINAGNLVADTAFTVEFLFKPGFAFNLTTFFRRLDGACGAYISTEGLVFYTNTVGMGSHDIKIPFDGIGKKSYGYLIDGNWHHLVFKYSSNTGKKEIYLDGECPAGFSANISGRINASSNTSIFFNQGVSYEKFAGQYDEIALYLTSLPATLIYKHYQEAMQGKCYSFSNNTSTLPTPSAITGPLDMTEFAPGHPNVNMPAMEQLKGFPLPRYKPGNTLLKNFNWIDLQYMGGRFQNGVTDAAAVVTSTAMNEGMAKNFNYMISGKPGSDPFASSWTSLANANPQLGLSIITFRAQLNPSNIRSQSLSSSNYLQNSSGQFIDGNGSTTSYKEWRPTAPISAYEDDGNQVKSNLQWYLTQLTRPITMINENGEVFHWYNDAALSTDPAVVAAKNASGLDFQTFAARKFKENETQAYRDKFMSLPGLSNTKFTEYAIDGYSAYRQKYSEARLVNSQINGQYYATPDFYPRWANNWRMWMGAWHGWQWIVDCRKNELAVGDKLFSPFVAAGWDLNEEGNVRPAQWLGLLKMMNILGSEFFYSGFFNEQGQYGPGFPLPANPANYVWQAVMPSYAQAVTSRFEDLLRNGNLMNGDYPNNYSNPTAPGYSFWTGDLRQLVSARKHASQAKYVLAGTVQPNTSMIGDAPNESTAQITLDGQSLKFKVRRQGSTYFYDKTNASSPVFYQLDEWHEKTHPSYWSKDFTVEAELYDNQGTNFNLKTTVPAGATAGDYTSFTTFISNPSGTTSFTPLEYVFRPRVSASTTYYLWVRARSKNGNSAGLTVSLDNGAAKTISCITDTVWNWYRYDACTMQPVQYTGMSITIDHTLRITPTNADIEFDKFMLSSNASLILNNAAPNCGAGGTASVSASGPVNFCTGGNVTLTASSGTGYLWSNGATTQSITVNQTGAYVVTVNQSAGCSGVSSPVNVTVTALTAPTITPSGSTNLCAGGSVTLNAPTGYTYFWTPGNSTSQLITVSTAGSYSVKVTNAQGCSATSPAVNVTTNGGTAATISASGPVTFCSGGSVTLTASSGSAYLWSNGTTSSTVNISQTGTYVVTVTNGSCQSVSAPVIVIVNALPTSNITASGATTFCDGGSVNLSASSGSAYLWSNGATSQTINATVSGAYVVSVTGSNGCKKTSAATNVVVNTNPVATIAASGSTTLCQGSSVTLTASAGSSFLWSPGNQTTQSISVNAAGNYTVRVTNSSGCSATSAATVVTVLSAGSATITPSGSTALCTGGSVSLTATQGTSYLWSNGAISRTITASQAGNYIVTVNNGSCSATSAPTAVTISANPTATITAGGSTALCQGATVTLTASAGATYLWSPGNQTTQSITVNAAGSYAVIVSNSAGCSATSAATIVTVSTSSSASITASGATTFCAGGNVNLTATQGTSYVWSNGATTRTITANQSGNYIVTVANGTCAATSPATVVTVNAIPTATITASGATTFAQGGSVTLTASAGSTYTWSTGATTQAIVVTSSGNYSVVVKNAAGCSATSAITAVTVTPVGIPASITTSTGANGICPSSTLTLSANAGTGYVWTPGLQLTQSITVSTPGTYTVTVVDAFGTRTSKSITVIAAANPAKPAVSYTYVPNTAYQLTAYEPSAKSYAWNTGSQLATITVPVIGNYTVKAINNYGCTGEVTNIAVASLTAQSCAKPDMLTAYNILDKQAMLAWNPAITADSFRIKYNAVGSTFSSTKYVKNATSVLATELLAATTYEVKVATLCGSNVNESGIYKFTTLAGPTGCGYTPLSTSTSYINNVSAWLNWFGTTASSVKIRYKVAGASSYTYQIVTATGTMWGYKLTGLQPRTTYVWAVLSDCGGVQSQYSPDISFTTLDNCGDVTNVNVTNITATNAEVKWTANGAIDKVRIRYIPAGGTNYITVTANASLGKKIITNLQPGTLYDFSVRSICTNNANSPWMAWQQFTTSVLRLDSTNGGLALNGYPNPATDLITYAFTSLDERGYTVKVADMSGRVLMQEEREAYEGGNTGNINLTQYATGVYLLIVKKGGLESHLRFAVHR